MTPDRRRHHRHRHPSQGDDTLTAGNTLADADGLGTISYQWQRRAMAARAGATSVPTRQADGSATWVTWSA